MFNYYNPCSMCIPVPIYLQDTKPMMPKKYDSMDTNNHNENNDDLTGLYPKIYFKIYPLVKEHCDIMEKEKGKHYCPCEKELNVTCKKIYGKIKPQLDEDEENYTRQRRYRRRHAVSDIVRILLINELLDRRRRDYDYGHDYDHDYEHNNHNHNYHYNFND